MPIGLSEMEQIVERIRAIEARLANFETWEPSFARIGAGPGYGGVTTLDDVDGTPAEVISDGVGDVTSGLTAMYWLRESGGGIDGNVIMVPNGGNVDLYDDGVDVFNLAIAADGSVTVVRTAGASTADVALWMVWI